LVLWPLRALPKPGDIIGEFSQLEATEDVSLKLYNDSSKSGKPISFPPGNSPMSSTSKFFPNGRRNATL